MSNQELLHEEKKKNKEKKILNDFINCKRKKTGNYISKKVLKMKYKNANFFINSDFCLIVR